MFLDIVCVAFGGGLGAVGRYLCGLLPAPNIYGFPLVTLTINFVGAFVIGLLSALWDNSVLLNFNLSERAMLFLKVGFCGGFTTFSTFSLEMFNLMDGGRYAVALIYALLSVFLCLCGVFLGRYLVKLIYGK